MVLCIPLLSAIISPFLFLICWFDSSPLFFLMSLATALSILFIFSKNQILVLLIFATVSCQGTFNFKGSNMFPSFVCRFSRTLCSLPAPGKQEQAEPHSVLRTEIMGKGTCLDSLQWLSSVTFYLKDYPFCCNWWNLILFNSWVIILLKIYKHVFLQMKYPYLTHDLGPLHPSSCRLQSPGTGLRRL